MDANIFRELQQQMFQLNPAGSLSDLRKIAGHTNDKIINDLAGYAHLASFNLFKEAQDFALDYFSKSKNHQLIGQTKDLIRFYKSERFVNRNFNVDEMFKSFCQKNGIQIIRTLQEGISNLKSCSWVYLAKDTDGIVKIFKEINFYKSGPLAGKFETEDKLFSLLSDNQFLPKYYGTIDVDGVKFFKQAVCFGPTLDLNKTVSAPEAKKIILDIAQAIDFLHSNNIAYLDLKPENLIYQNGKIILLDLGISQRVNKSNETDIYLSDARFTTPEGTTRLKASKASDVFQMGVFYHWLLHGQHPLEIIPFRIENLDKDRESSLLRYAWPTAVLNYSDLYSGFNNQYNSLIKNMLDSNPNNRPSAKDLIQELQEHQSFPVANVWQKSSIKEKNTIFFPARMGIPHQGHIEYISRIINLGYHILISIQRSYTITNRDPIPKFLVLRMVAQSLIGQGFTPGQDFSFVLTPYPFDQAELEYHFFNLPQINDLVGVASNNPGVHNFFYQKLPILDQNSVFGVEGQSWQVRSWGEIIRTSVRQNDYSTFQQYVASGVEKILSFDEIREVYANPLIEFAKTVDVVAVKDGNEIARGRVFRYQTPEQSLFRHLSSFGNFEVKARDLYQKDLEIELNGKSTKMLYLKTDFNQDLQYESIYFNLI